MRIFIGWDSRFPEPALVLEWSLRKHSSIPLDIRFLKYDELRRTLGFNRKPDPLASTEFTYTRFLVPFLCDYRGMALFLDNDMLCFDDISQITELPMDGLALRVTQHDYRPTADTKMDGVKQTVYPRKNWSSFMWMDCSKLKLWTKEAVETASGAYLHRFEDIPREQIGKIDLAWNSLDRALVKMGHWTSGGPWFEECRDCPDAEVWLKAKAEYESDRNRWQRTFRHPDPSFGLL